MFKVTLAPTDDEEGFTLVELMVVVSIVGVLAAIAIPQYSKFQAKARQAEAKISLSSVYTVEQAYYAETGSFGGVLTNMGYTAPAGGKRYYTFGFAGPWAFGGGMGNCSTTSGISDTCDRVPYNGGAPGLCTLASNTCYFPANAATNGQAPWTAPTGPAWAAVSGVYFRAEALGHISGTTLMDVWSLDHDKQLVNQLDGL